MFSALSASFKSSILKEFDTLLDARIQGVIEGTLKKVADDYKLSYGELKMRYTLTPIKTVTVDLEDEEYHESAEHSAITETFARTPDAPVAKVVTPNAPIKVSPEQLPMSKMKKRDLELECERRGLCPDGTISELKERVKQARLLEKPAKKARKPKDPNAPKKERKPKDPNAPKKVKEVPPPAPAVVPLEDEEFYPCKPCVVPEPEDREEPEEELGLEDEDLEDEDNSMKARLRKILQDAGELDEDEEFEDEE